MPEVQPTLASCLGNLVAYVYVLGQLVRYHGTYLRLVGARIYHTSYLRKARKSKWGDLSSVPRPKMVEIGFLGCSKAIFWRPTT
jgi:hypothetical protein